MIGELVTGKADMAFVALALTSTRSIVVLFEESFLQVALVILITYNHADELELFNSTLLQMSGTIS